MENNRISYLESKLPKDKNLEDKNFNNFQKYATYLGNGVYEWRGIKATNTRELFLMGILLREGIDFKRE